jgi:hypothetical protein
MMLGKCTKAHKKVCYDYYIVCCYICWPSIDLDKKLFGKPNERLVFLQVCSHILVPLCQPGEVFLETGYRGCIASDRQYAALKCANFGMGSKSVWHGFPDARVRGAEVQQWSDAEITDDVEYLSA